MKCLNCNEELFKRGLAIADGSFCAGEPVHIKWTANAEEYIECKHCKAKNFLEDVGPHTFTIRRFRID